MPDSRVPRDRAWLRTFLHLDGLASPGNIPTPDIERQEDTVLRALDMLDQGPGVMLADGVGMGKTFEALGVLAAREQLRPGSRFLVLTPSPELTRKWRDELRRFTRDRKVFGGFSPDEFEDATRLGPFLAATERRRLIVAPVTMFLKPLEADQNFVMGAFCQWKGLHGSTRKSLFDKVGSGLPASELPDARFLERYRYADLEPHLDRVFRRGDDGEDDPAAIYDADPDDFVKRSKNLLTVARFRLVRALLPAFDMLVLDEAHKLKNADTVRAQGISVALRGKFDRALFLTATPFQLGVDELRQIFALFGLAASASPDLAAESGVLLADVHAYQIAYAAFERDWRRLDDVAAAAFAAHLAGDPDLAQVPAEPTLRPVAAHLLHLFELKQGRLEPAFRRWMIRSVRNDLTYRDLRPVRLKAEGPAALPFLAYERMIDEIFRQGDRTHKAAVQINMVSSYGAAWLSDVLKTDPDSHAEVERYRGLLRSVLGRIGEDRVAHPKLRHVLQDALVAAEHDGEKTLIFCTRKETLRELQRELRGAWEDRLLLRWRRAYPDAGFVEIFGSREEDEHQRGRHTQLQQRFQRMQHLPSLALRERYLQTLLEFEDWGERHLDAIVARAQELLTRVRTKQLAAERVHFGLLKRVVEVAAVELRAAAEPAWAGHFAGPVGTILNPRYIALGYDLVVDDLEDDVRGTHTPTWQVNPEHARVVVSERPHLWSYFKSGLYNLPDVRRVRVVERLAHYLTYRSVPFLADLMASARDAGLDVHDSESARLLELADAFWETAPGRGYLRRIKDFLLYFHDLDEDVQNELLARDLLKGHFVRQTSEAETRDNLREAFNTSLHPMVLIANEVMQEGLDLHRACRRVVHHDLPWNPAQLEQRVGRVDRIGSRIRHLLPSDPTAKLTVLFPLIHQTIDTKIHKVVRDREKWLEFLLGARPEVDPEAFDAVPPPPLPDAVVQRLRVDLSPRA